MRWLQMTPSTCRPRPAVSLPLLFSAVPVEDEKGRLGGIVSEDDLSRRVQ